MLLTMAMESGIIASLVFFLMILGIFFNRHRKSVEGLLGTNTIWQFTIVILVLFVAAGNLLDRRIFFVVLGTVFTMVNLPWKVFAWNAPSRSFTGVLNGEDILRTRRFRKWIPTRGSVNGPEPSGGDNVGRLP